MATTTTPRKKTTGTPKPRAKAQPKPKTVGQWLDRKFAPRKYRTVPGAIVGNTYKATRGIVRVGKRRAEIARERKRARQEHRSSAYPTWNERRKQVRDERRGARNQCLGCNRALHRDELARHATECSGATVATPPAPPPTRKPRASPTAAPPPPPPAPPSGRPPEREEIRQWKRARAAHRKATMTRRARAWDATRRASSRAFGFGGQCATCGMNLGSSDVGNHRCGGTYVPPATPQVAAAPTAPPPRRPAPTGAQPQPAPPSTNNGKEAPVALLGRGNGGNGAATGGSGNSSAHAAQVLQAMSAWSNDIPKTHTEMGANMQAMAQMCTGMAQLVQEFQGRLINMPPGPDGAPRGFHPSTVAPLSGPDQRFAEASAGFTETFVAITRYYQVLIDMHQSGTPVPDAAYLRG